MSKDSLEHAQKRRVVGAILLSREGKVLLGRRSELKSEYVGLWQAPGGGLHEGESVEDAARREVLEETGIDLGGLPAEPLQTADDDPFFIVAMVLFRLPLPSADYEPRCCGEFSELDWFGLAELPPLVPGGVGVFQCLKFFLVNS
jgi:8-oxo-dGTP pyrophosphatase MutT (NUDIX family)